MKSVIKKFIQANINLSHSFDLILPKKYRTDGNRYFIEKFAPFYLQNSLTVYDIGGGKNPYISQETKHKLKLKIIGLDIDQDELNRAPVDAYDKTICADVTECRGQSDADLIICQALLEHVKNRGAPK